MVRSLGDGRELLAVADGMGGHQAGEIASARALEVLTRELEAGARLFAAVRSANAAVYTDAGRAEERQGMGTTLVAVLTKADSYEIANVGDSRAYRIDGAGIHQLTVDHSFAAEAVRTGSMSSEEIAASPWRHALTRAVGTDPNVEIDIFGPVPLEPPLVILLCSDGLYRAVPETVIREYVLATEDLQTAVTALAALAYRRGSDDNITVAALEIGSLARRSPTITLPVAIPRQLASGPKSARRVRTREVAGDSRSEAAPRVADATPARGNGQLPTAYIQLALVLLLLAAVLGFIGSLMLG